MKGQFVLFWVNVRGRGSSGLFLALIEGAVTRYQLAAKDRALFAIATEYMELALEHSAIMTRVFISSPVIVFGAVTDTRNDSPFDR